MPSKDSHRAFVVLLVLGLLCLWAVLAEISNAGAFNYYCNDDAYITFTYAKNLIHGHGLVFTAGQKVEGYTNFLWLIFLAPWMKLFPGIDVSKIAIFWGAFFSVAVLALTYLLGYQERKHHWTNLIAPALLSFDNTFHYWSVSGLENSMQTALVLCALLYLFRGNRKSLFVSGAIFAFATMARPDSGLFWAVAVLALGLRAVRERKAGGSLVDAVRLSAGFLVVLIPYAAWKLVYYGNLLPNPFYLHTGNRMQRIPHGSNYLMRFLQNRFFIPLLSAGSMIRGYMFRRAVLLLSVVAFCLYAVWIGGDFFPGSRFFYVILPLVYLLIQDVLCSLARQNEMPAPVLAGFACVILAAAVFHGTYGPRGEYEGFVLTWAQDDYNRIQLAKDLSQVAREGDSILSGPIGQIAYYSGLRVLDYWGVTDPHIARARAADSGASAPGHGKTDLPYLLRQKPTYIIFGVDAKNPPAGYSLHEIRVQDRRWIVLKQQ